MTTNLVGYKLRNIETDEIINQWGGVWGQDPGVPQFIIVPMEEGKGVHIFNPKLNHDYYGYELTEFYMDPPAPSAQPISDRQFFQQAAKQGLITKAEALAAVKSGAIPTSLQTIIDGIIDADEKFAAEMLLSGATVFDRNHPLVGKIVESLNWSPEQIDQFFIDAGTL